jgi:hypothetical protein
MGFERLSDARAFIYGNARQVDRAAYEVSFDAAPAERLLDALRSYANPDGGYGHALEPDLRTPASQPLHTETALAILQQCGVRRPDIANRCCDFLAGVARPDGALPAFLPGALDYPAAPHWQAGFGGEPTLDRTLGMTALLQWHGARHPWLERAVSRCRAHVAGAAIIEAHHLLYAFQFATELLEGAEQSRTLRRLYESLQDAEFYVADTPVTRYGLTPLHYATSPDHPALELFGRERIERHLDDLSSAQLPDGGWPIRFQPPSEGARIEWRGRWTMEALLALRAYGRL